LTTTPGPLLGEIKQLPRPTGELLAWNPVAHRGARRLPMLALNGGGLLTTAGNLVLQRRSDGILAAYRATDGRKLWEFDAGTGIMAPPMTYLVDQGVRVLDRRRPRLHGAFEPIMGSESLIARSWGQSQGFKDSDPMIGCPVDPIDQ